MVIKVSLIALVASILLLWVSYKADAIMAAGAFYGVATIAVVILMFAIPLALGAKILRWLRRP